MLEMIKSNSIELDRDNLMVFEVEPGAGVRIIPMSQTRA
jgi:archaellum biogenesis ATPase FlaH